MFIAMQNLETLNTKRKELIRRLKFAQRFFYVLLTVFKIYTTLILI